MSGRGEHIAIERRGAVAWLTICRPEHGNALRSQDVVQLKTYVEDCLVDAAVRIVVIAGYGNKFFCSGADLDELSQGLPDVPKHIGKWHVLVRTISHADKPIIAAMNGLAAGGGLELALACHQRIAVIGCRLGLPEVKVGLFPAANGISRLSALVGPSVALRLVLSAELIPASEAFDLGIVDQLLLKDGFADQVHAFAERLAGYEPNAVRAVLKCVQAGSSGTDTSALEARLLDECYSRAENRALVDAFVRRLHGTQ